MDPLIIAGRAFNSRLLMGTALYPNHKVLHEALEASGAKIVTVAIRRVSAGLEAFSGNYFLLPNTAGCYTAKEAVLTAQLAREALQTNWIKLEVIGDDKTLYPDVPELLKAAYELVRDGFVVLPYCSDDLVTCRKLADMGCAAVMPLVGLIGSGMGICNPYNLQIIREQIEIPVIADAGIGTASDVAIAMEYGLDGVLLNTAVAQAKHPVLMARSMRLACEAGRLAYRAGRVPRKLYAANSSPKEGVIDAAHAHVCDPHG